MNKYIPMFLLAAYLAVANIPVAVQATTRDEMLKQIAALTELVSILQAQLAAQTSLGQVGTYYIESGDVIFDKKTKTAQAVMTFGMSDILTVRFTYSDEKKILDEALVAVRKKRPSAQYVSRANIKIREGAVESAADSGKIILVPITGTVEIPSRPSLPAEVEISPQQQKREDFRNQLARCSAGKSYKRQFTAEWILVPTESYTIVGKSGDNCKLNYEHTFAEERTKMTVLRVAGSCTFDPRVAILGDPLEVASLLPYMTLLHKKDEAQRSKIEREMYNVITAGDYEEFVSELKKYNFGINCTLKTVK